MQFEHEINGQEIMIEWERTGEVLEVISIYDRTEVVLGYDDEGNNYIGNGVVSCDSLLDVIEIELETKDYESEL